MTTETYDIYARISDEGDRTQDEVAKQLAVYEAACRDWAERNGIGIGMVVHETNISGSAPIAERELGRLLERIEWGKSAGILTPHLDRFGRDQIEGCLAWKRIAEAGGRLVCVNDGLDSSQPGAKLNFQIRMAIAEDFLDRTRANFQARIEAKAEEGAYLACKPPVGYEKNHDTGRIYPHPALAPLIQQAFERRADGETCRAIALWLREAGGEIAVPNPKHPKKRKSGESDDVFPLAKITENGVRHLLKNDAYLGACWVQTRTKGAPRKIENAHQPMVTPDLWERAQAAGGPHRPNTGRLAAQVRLAGLVYCSGCGRRLKVGGRGRNNPNDAAYVCTAEGCPARVGIAAATLDQYVADLIQYAIVSDEPHVVAVLAGDDRYEHALASVEHAKLELDMYRAEIKVSDVGVEQWKADVATRQTVLDLARAALREVPPTKPPYQGKHPGSVEAIGAAMDRDANGRLVARVVVKTSGKGRRLPPRERTDVYFVGAEEPYVMPEPQTMPLVVAV